MVDVRFFGAHDRSWVPTSQVFMLSKDIPTPMRNKRQAGFDNAMHETNTHIEKLTSVKYMSHNFQILSML